MSRILMINAQHTYDVRDYQVVIAGVMESFGIDNLLTVHRTKLIAVPNLGNLQFRSLRFAFAECENLEEFRGGQVSAVYDLHGTFSGALKVKPQIAQWDVATVTDMGSLFANAQAANPDVHAWQVGRVTNMSSMFYNAKAATPDVSNWDVSAVTTIEPCSTARRSPSPMCRSGTSAQ